MTGRQSARTRIKSSVGAAFYPCCALGRTLGSEGSVVGSVGSSGVGDVVYPGRTLVGFEPSANQVTIIRDYFIEIIGNNRV